MLGQEMLDSIATERPAPNAGKQGTRRITGPFSQPSPQSSNHILAQRRGALLASFASASYRAADPQSKIFVAKTGEF
jgi:hypothetical protein